MSKASRKQQLDCIRKASCKLFRIIHRNNFIFISYNIEIIHRERDIYIIYVYIYICIYIDYIDIFNTI